MRPRYRIHQFRQTKVTRRKLWSVPAPQDITHYAKRGSEKEAIRGQNQPPGTVRWSIWSVRRRTAAAGSNAEIPFQNAAWHLALRDGGIGLANQSHAAETRTRPALREKAP
jgi:hypothetical protein